MPRPRTFEVATIVDVARDAFRADGYAGTSTDKLVAATGLGKGSLYGAFGSKHALFLAALDRYRDDIMQSAHYALDGPDDTALTRLHSFFDDMTRRADDGTPCGCLLAKGVAELAERDVEVADRARRTFDALQQLIAATLEAAQRHGEVSPAADPMALSRLLLVLHRGLDAVATAGLDDMFLRDVVFTMFELLLSAGSAGLSPPTT